MFSDIRISHVRGFQSLALMGLKPINLIVGANNVGKTSLLEALALQADPSTIKVLPTLFRLSAGDVQKRFYKWLVHDSFAGSAEIVAKSEMGEQTVRLSRKPGIDATTTPLHVYNSNELQVYTSQKFTTCTYRCVSTRQTEPEELVRMYSAAMGQKNGEEIMEAVLRTVDARFRKIRPAIAPDGNHIMVDLGFSEMLPLPQAGQGLYRLVTILSGLIGDRPNIALIDEIDDGIHYSALSSVWTGLAEASSKLGIQIFVTTHSYECIQAAHEVFAGRPTYDLGVIQLFRVGDRVDGRVLQKDEIQAALDGGIDLR